MPQLQLILDKIGAHGQRQDATSCQKRDVESFLLREGVSDMCSASKVHVANRLGCYDAADMYKIDAAAGR